MFHGIRLLVAQLVKSTFSAGTPVRIPGWDNPQEMGWLSLQYSWASLFGSDESLAQSICNMGDLGSNPWFLESLEGGAWQLPAPVFLPEPWTRDPGEFLVTQCKILAAPWTVACRGPLSLRVLRAKLLGGVASGLPPSITTPCQRWILYHRVTWEALTTMLFHG